MKNIIRILLVSILVLSVSCQSSDDYEIHNIEGMEFKAYKKKNRNHPVIVVKEVQANGDFLTRDIVERRVNRKPNKFGIFINDGQGFIEYYTVENGWEILATEAHINDLSRTIRELNLRIDALEAAQ